MAEEEGFLRRWARRKAEGRLGGEPAGKPPQPHGVALDQPQQRPNPAPPADAEVPADAGVPVAPVDAAADGAAVAIAPATSAAAPAARPLPTMDDVAALHKDSDFSAFVVRGVEQAVRRGALKKLFADPHFNAMDRLDVYIDDYTRPSPLSESMLASLEHAKSVFRKLIEEEPAAADAEPQAAAQAGPAPSQPQQSPDQEIQ